MTIMNSQHTSTLDRAMYEGYGFPSVEAQPSLDLEIAGCHVYTERQAGCLNLVIRTPDSEYRGIQATGLDMEEVMIWTGSLTRLDNSAMLEIVVHEIRQHLMDLAYAGSENMDFLQVMGRFMDELQAEYLEA